MILSDPHLRKELITGIEGVDHWYNLQPMIKFKR